MFSSPSARLLAATENILTNKKKVTLRPTGILFFFGGASRENHQNYEFTLGGIRNSDDFPGFSTLCGNVGGRQCQTYTD